MGLLRNLSFKNIVLTTLAAVSAVISVLALLFGFMGNELEEPLSAYTQLLEYGRLPRMLEISPIGTILALIAILISLFSVTKLLFTVLFVSNSGAYKKGIKKVVTIALISSVVFMIAGTVASLLHTYEIFGSFYYATEMHIPLIMNVIVSVLYRAANACL